MPLCDSLYKGFSKNDRDKKNADIETKISVFSVARQMKPNPNQKHPAPWLVVRSFFMLGVGKKRLYLLQPDYGRVQQTGSAEPHAAVLYIFDDKNSFVNF